jgi:hypothetical protein
LKENLQSWVENRATSRPDAAPSDMTACRRLPSFLTISGPPLGAALLAAFLAACGGSGARPDVGSDAGVTPSDAQVGADGAATPVSPLDPDFGPEGNVSCPSAHFCLEFPSTTYEPLSAIAATPAGGLYAVGPGGTVLHSHSGGAKWATVSVPTTADLNAVAVAPSTVIIAGANGTLLRLVNGAFQADPLDTDATLTSLYVAGDNDAWTVGNLASDSGTAQSVVLHWNGSAWSPVGGSSSTDVWIGGGDVESVALYHLSSGAWTAVPDAVLSTDAEGPIRALLVDSPTAVHAASDGINFRDLLLFDGMNWTVEDEKPLLLPGDNAYELVRAPDGTIWSASDPPYVRMGTAWQPAAGAPTLGVSVAGIAWSAGQPVVAGDNGLLGPLATVDGPIAGIVSGKAFPTGNVVLGTQGLFSESPSYAFTSLATNSSMAWLGANSATDIAALAIISGDGEDDPYQSLTAYRSNGGAATTALNEMPFPGPYAVGLGYAPNGDLWWTQGGGDSPLLGKLSRTATSWSEVKCNGASMPAMQLWTDGTDTLIRTDNGTTVKLYHITSTGTCTALTANFYWFDDRTIGGSSYSDLWTLDGTSAVLGHWNGSSWSQAATTPEVYCSLLVFGPTDIWLGECGATMSGITHWDGTTFTAYEVGVELQSPSIWGTDDTHLWLGDSQGRIFRYMP